MEKALIDEKDILTDWVEDVFDGCSSESSRKHAMLGFFKSEPTMVEWYDNTLKWSVFSEKRDVVQKLAAFLMERLDDNNGLRVEYTIEKNVLYTQFYHTENKTIGKKNAS